MKNSNIKLNIFSSYLSQIYIIFISIAILPYYIKYMGVEAYGLVGFFALLQALFSLLDFGLRPTISRQTAQYNGGSLSAIKFRQLFRSLHIIFFIVAIAGGTSLLLSSNYLANHWLNIENLNIKDVIFCLYVMSISISLRWTTGLYRGVISGFERIIWLSRANALVATLRFPCVLMYMYFFGFTVKSFFTYQLLVALLEFFIYAIKCNSLMPKLLSNLSIGWSLKPIKPFLAFAIINAITASIWVFITQLDKLVLSGVLSLSDYGYFSLSVLVAAGIMQISTPISTAIMPRMARLEAEKNYNGIKKIYLNSTRLISIIVVTAGIVLASVSEQFLYAWTGDKVLAIEAGPILQLYALGNAFLALSAFPYYLQYAKGQLKYHLLGNIFMLVILLPSIIWAAKKYGAIGAGWTWFITQALYLVVWATYVHIKIEPGINVKWFKSFLPSFLAAYIFNFLTSSFFHDGDSRGVIAFKILVISIISLIISAVASLRSNDVTIIKRLYEKYLM